MLYFEGQAPRLSWDEIHANAINAEDLNFEVTTAKLLWMLKGIELFVELFEPLSEPEIERLRQLNQEIYLHLKLLSLNGKNDERAQITDQLRSTLKALWGKPAVAAIIYQNLPNVHEANSQQERRGKKNRPPQGW